LVLACSWLALGCLWLLLACLLAPGCLSGCSWLSLVAPGCLSGCSWVPPGCLLAAPCWLLFLAGPLLAPGLAGVLFAAPGCSWLLPAGVWLLMVASVCSWLLLVAPGRWSAPGWLLAGSWPAPGRLLAGSWLAPGWLLALLGCSWLASGCSWLTAGWPLAGSRLD
jgi:hypothetical protein